ncbi:MAG: hypothetical protein NVS9B15_11690 [Acidobacteriaceae bacterium]
MIPELRARFNANYTPEKYRDFISNVNRASGSEVKFRLSETPIFLPRAMMAKMERYGAELVHQLVGNPGYHLASDISIPPEFNAPNEDSHPLFIQVDFGLVRDADGELQPKLVELQGFPSLYAYQPAVANAYVQAYGLPDHLTSFSSGLDERSYRELFCRAVLNGNDPKHVILLEIDPQQQKTLPDFNLTKTLCGVETVNIRDLIKRGNQLWYRSEGGQEIRIKRIYNRAIVDELVRKKLTPPFDYRDELDVEWAGHPNWYFRMSKFSIPFLKHASVPKTWFLDELESLPADRNDYLLKPLYSFAGSGVLFSPSDSDIAAIPRERRHDYILQERLSFEPVIETPHGMTQAEIRIMYIWLPDAELTPTMALVRMGRGKMMGVDHNRDLEWVGASAGLMLAT